MKYILFIIICLMSTTANASDITDKIKKSLSYKNCSVSVHNGKLHYNNCKASKKVTDALSDIEYAKNRKKWENQRKFELKVEKKINKAFGKLFK
jgi:hypothetical protein